MSPLRSQRGGRRGSEETVWSVTTFTYTQGVVRSPLDPTTVSALITWSVFIIFITEMPDADVRCWCLNHFESSSRLFLASMVSMFLKTVNYCIESGLALQACFRSGSRPGPIKTSDRETESMFTFTPHLQNWSDTSVQLWISCFSEVGQELYLDPGFSNRNTLKKVIVPFFFLSFSFLFSNYFVELLLFLSIIAFFWQWLLLFVVPI